MQTARRLSASQAVPMHYPHKEHVLAFIHFPIHTRPMQAAEACSLDLQKSMRKDGESAQRQRRLYGTCEWSVMPFPRIWLNFFSPTTLRKAMTRGVKGPLAETLPMFRPMAPDFLAVDT